MRGGRGRAAGAAALLLLLLLHLAAAVNIISDEALWTKQDWQRHAAIGLGDPMADFNPSDAFPASLRELLARSKYNSLDGPTPRRTITRAPT